MIEDVLEAAKRGMRGEVVGLKLTSHPKKQQRSKLGSFISLNKGRYIVSGGVAGSGKTAVLDSEFLLKPFENYVKYGGTKPYWIYRAMERPLLEKKTKWLAWKIFIDRGVIYDVPTILGHENKIRDLNDQDIALFESYDDWFKELFKHVDLIAGASSPEEIKNYGLRRAYQRGKMCWSERGKWIVNGAVRGEVKKSSKEFRQGSEKFYIDYPWGRVWEGETVYFDDVENEMMLHYSDHLGKLVGEASEQHLINEHGKNMGDIFRDILGWTIIDIMQFNRETYDTTRQLKQRLQVTEKDFRMSSVPFHNADVVFGLLNPFKYNKKKHRGYDIGDEIGSGFVNERGYNRFRGLDLVKNSYGIDDVSLGYVFIGECGYVEELPASHNLTDNDYENYRNAKLKIYA